MIEASIVLICFNSESSTGTAENGATGADAVEYAATWGVVDLWKA